VSTLKKTILTSMLMKSIKNVSASTTFLPLAMKNCLISS
jgi:hypothetical protein